MSDVLQICFILILDKQQEKKLIDLYYGSTGSQGDVHPGMYREVMAMIGCKLMLK